MPCAIVRPSIIGAVNGAPYPGYTGNLAGVSGAQQQRRQRGCERHRQLCTRRSPPPSLPRPPAGIAAAFAVGFCTPGAAAWPGSNVIDVVPGDLVTSVTLAAGAAVLLGAPAARLQQEQRRLHKSGTCGESASTRTDWHVGSILSVPAARCAAAGDLPLIVHACTSASYPLTVATMANTAYDFWSRNPPKYRCALL